MGREFWRTIRAAIEKDNWTARLVVVLLMAAVALLGGCVIVAAGWPEPILVSPVTRR